MPKKTHRLLLFALVVLAGAANSTALAQRFTATLHGRAKKAGGRLVWRYRPDRSLIYPSLEGLAKRSDLIVVGRTISHRPNLRPDGKFITEGFLVRVQEVIKGVVPNGGSILVSLPGGSHRFPDGTSASVIPVGYARVEDRGTYVFFLRKKGTVYKGHEPISATQGVFDLTSGIVRPADLVATDPVVERYRGMGAAAFLARIHKAVPHKKKQ